MSRIPLTCDELIPLRDAADFLGVDEGEIEARDRLTGEYTTAVLQAGAVSCQWTGPAVGEDLAVGMTLDILAEASAEFSQHKSFQDPSSVLDSVSPGSVIICEENSGLFSCSISFLVHGYWVELAASSFSTGRSSSVGPDLGAAIAQRLTAAGAPRAEYVPAPESLGVGSSCSAIDGGGTLSTALRSSQLAAPSDDVPDTGQFVIAVSERAGRLMCNWGLDFTEGAVQQVTVVLTPGGSWNFAAVVADDPQAQPITVDGATRAVGHLDGALCAITADIEGSLLYILVIDNGAPGGDSCATAQTVAQIVRAAA